MKAQKLDATIENLKKQLEVEVMNKDKVNPLFMGPTPNKVVDQQPNLLSSNAFTGNTDQVEMLNSGIKSQSKSMLTFKQGDTQNELNDRADFPQRITEVTKDKPQCATCMLDK